MILFPCETRWGIVHANKMSVHANKMSVHANKMSVHANKLSVYANKMSVDSKVELRLSALSIGRILAPAETELKNFLYLPDTPST